MAHWVRTFFTWCDTKLDCSIQKGSQRQSARWFCATPTGSGTVRSDDFRMILWLELTSHNRSKCGAIIVIGEAILCARVSERAQLLSYTRICYVCEK